MCALYDGAVVAAVSTLCWVAKQPQCQACTYGVVMALVKPMQAVDRCPARSSLALPRPSHLEPRPSAPSQSSVLVCFG